MHHPVAEGTESLRSCSQAEKTGADQHDFTRNGGHVDIGIEPFLHWYIYSKHGIFTKKQGRNSFGVALDNFQKRVSTIADMTSHQATPSIPHVTLFQGLVLKVCIITAVLRARELRCCSSMFFHSMWTWLLTHFLGTIDCHSDSYSP